MRKLNAKAFTVVELLLVVMVAGVIAAVGWYIYDQNQKTDEPGAATITNFDECKAAGNPIAESYPEQCMADGKTFVNTAQSKTANPDDALLFSNDDVSLYSISKLAVTDEQKAQAAVLDAECLKRKANSVATAGTKELFTTENSNYVSEGNFARFNANCYVAASNEPLYGGAGKYLEKIDGVWTFWVTSQMALPCTMVDGKGVPKSIMSTCVAEDNTIRTPQQ